MMFSCTCGTSVMVQWLQVNSRVALLIISTACHTLVTRYTACHASCWWMLASEPELCAAQYSESTVHSEVHHHWATYLGKRAYDDGSWFSPYLTGARVGEAAALCFIWSALLYTTSEAETNVQYQITGSHLLGRLCARANIFHANSPWKICSLEPLSIVWDARMNGNTSRYEWIELQVLLNLQSFMHHSWK